MNKFDEAIDKLLNSEDAKRDKQILSERQVVKQGFPVRGATDEAIRAEIWAIYKALMPSVDLIAEHLGKSIEFNGRM